MSSAFPHFHSKKKCHAVRRAKSQSGQALVEYVLLLSIAVSLALAFNSFFTRSMHAGVLKFNAVLESELRTGEFQSPSNVSTWEN